MEPDQATSESRGWSPRTFAPYRAGRPGDWLKIRQKTLVDAAVIGVTGSLARPLELVLTRPDEDGELRRIGATSQ